MASKPSSSKTVDSIDRNGTRNSSLNSCPNPWKPRFFKPESMKYTSEFLGFISKVREPSTGTASENELNAPTHYVLRSGLHNPKICPKISEMNIPFQAKMFSTDARYNEVNRESHFILNKLSCLTERSPWGFEQKLVDTKPYIPCNIHDARENQHMPPIRQYIKWNPDLLQRIKPKFVCDRNILKGIMTLAEPHYYCTFFAEKKDGVIYLREVHDAPISTADEGGRKDTKIVTSVILSAQKDRKETPIDMNEATYGAYVGHVGPDIKVLFSAELDAFWGPLKETPNGEVDSTGLEKKIVELNTTQLYHWSDRNWGHWKTMMAENWAQCHLIGSEDVITSVLLKSDDVCEVLHLKANSMLETVKCYNGHIGTEKEVFFFNRLRSALLTLQEQIVEDFPAVYIATVSHPKLGKVVADVCNIRSFSNFPTL